MIGKVLDYQAKQVTYNIYRYYKKRKSDKNTYEHNQDINLIDTVSTVTSLSKSTVTRVIREGNAMLAIDGVVIFKPLKKKKHIRKKRIVVDEITEAIIRRKVIQFYTVKNEVPSVRRLNALLKKENILNCSNEYLRQLLHKLGFTNADSDSKGMLREHSDIVSQRLSYLNAIKSFRANGKDIFFLNDTMRWSEHNVPNVCIPKNMPSFIIVHASGSIGFLDKSILMVKTRPENHDDYDLNNESFENYVWVKDTVLPNVPQSSVIIVNFPLCEASESADQDEIPTMASTRTYLENWLNRYNIPYKETALKSDLLQLIQSQEAKAKYNIGKLILKKGHEVLSLPKNHLDLNPAVIMWKKVKEDAENTSPKELITTYTKTKWEKLFENVRKNEEEYYEHDSKIDDADHIMQLKEETKSETDSEDTMDCDY